MGKFRASASRHESLRNGKEFWITGGFCNLLSVVVSKPLIPSTIQESSQNPVDRWFVTPVPHHVQNQRSQFPSRDTSSLDLSWCHFSVIPETTALFPSLTTGWTALPPQPWMWQFLSGGPSSAGPIRSTFAGTALATAAAGLTFLSDAWAGERGTLPPAGASGAPCGWGCWGAGTTVAGWAVAGCWSAARALWRSCIFSWRER